MYINQEEMGLRENIRKAIAAQGFKSIHQFALQKKINYQYLNAILNEDRRFNEDWLKGLAKALGLSMEALFSSGPVEINAPPLLFEQPKGDFAAIKVFADPVCLGPGYNMNDLVPAGWLPMKRENLPIGFNSHADRVVCFPAAGDSMRPTINPGSYVWIDTDPPTIEENGIYAFLLPDESVTIKRLVKVCEDQIVIDADNPDACERAAGSLRGFPMALQPREDVNILRGRVIWILNRLLENSKEKAQG